MQPSRVLKAPEIVLSRGWNEPEGQEPLEYSSAGAVLSVGEPPPLPRGFVLSEPKAREDARRLLLRAEAVCFHIPRLPACKRAPIEHEEVRSQYEYEETVPEGTRTTVISERYWLSPSIRKGSTSITYSLNGKETGGVGIGNSGHRQLLGASESAFYLSESWYEVYAFRPRKVLRWYRSSDACQEALREMSKHR